MHTSIVEGSSQSSFRRRRLPVSPPPRLTSAARHYKGLAWLPPELVVPEAIPREAKLPAKYNVGYYGSSLAFWTLLSKSPLDRSSPWSADLPWNGAFADKSTGWEHPTSDASFARLRLQGPNPFLLQHDPDAPPGSGEFVLDHGPLFAGIAPSVSSRFTDGPDGLVAVSVTIDGRQHTPGMASWDDAKRVVNGLDARYVTFVQHLLNSHLIVGQAYALAAFSLPTWHPLRPMIDFFTYGTLAVNDTAYRSLLTPKSYFITSGFVSVDAARQLITNTFDRFDFTHFLPLKDIENRGVDRIHGHPYVEDARLVWPHIEQVVRDHLQQIDLASDAAVDNDPHLGAFHRTLCEVMPNSETIPALSGAESLVDLLAAMIYNNVIHEVAGNLSPILDSHDPRDKAVVNLDDLVSIASSPGCEIKPASADVFLMDQATYAAAFHVKGNALLGMNIARVVDDPKLRDSLIDLQATFRRVDDEVMQRNVDRAIPFEALRPSTWEASISF